MEIVTTREETMKRFNNKLGFEPQAKITDIIKRDSFASEEEYIIACIEFEKSRNTPEYREARKKYMAERELEEENKLRAAQEKRFEELKKGIELDCTAKEDIQLTARKIVDDELASNKITFSQYADRMQECIDKLTAHETDVKAGNAFFNEMLRSNARSMKGNA